MPYLLSLLQSLGRDAVSPNSPLIHYFIILFYIAAFLLAAVLFCQDVDIIHSRTCKPQQSPQLVELKHVQFADKQRLEPETSSSVIHVIVSHTSPLLERRLTRKPRHLDLRCRARTSFPRPPSPLPTVADSGYLLSPSATTPREIINNDAGLHAWLSGVEEAFRIDNIEAPSTGQTILFAELMSPLAWRMESSEVESVTSTDNPYVPSEPELLAPEPLFAVPGMKVAFHEPARKNTRLPSEDIPLSPKSVYWRERPSEFTRTSYAKEHAKGPSDADLHAQWVEEMEEQKRKARTGIVGGTVWDEQGRCYRLVNPKLRDSVRTWPEPLKPAQPVPISAPSESNGNDSDDDNGTEQESPSTAWPQPLKTARPLQVRQPLDIAAGDSDEDDFAEVMRRAHAELEE